MKRTFQENHEEVNESDNEDDNDEEEEEEDEDFEAMTLEEGDDDDDDDDDDDGEEEEEEEDGDEDMEDERTSTINLDTRASDGNIDGNNEFLDSFYGISSSDIKERTIAGRIMIHHCLLSNTPATTSTTSNVESTTSSSLSPLQIKDATYALRRLMNGLCSGRAAARQGNAATLSSFIKVAISLQQIPDIRNEWLSKEKGNYKNSDTEQQQQSDLAFIRYALISVTEPTVSSTGTGTSKRSQQGHKSSSEEREYKLGRLFGITAIIRSGVIRHLILSSSTSSEASVQNSDTIGKDIFNIVNDLIGLYRYKKWIREPVAHAICSLLYSLFVPDTSSTTNSTNTIIQEVVTHVVEQLIIPQLLIKGDDDSNETKQQEQAGDDDNRLISLLSTYSAEQIALSVCIQTIYNNDPNHTLSYPLNHTILCTETIPIFATALCVTTNSIMTQSPRIHLVWDVIIEYISESFTYNISNNSNNTKMDYRRLKELLPFQQALDSDKVDDIIRTIIQSVIIERLLGIEPSNKNIDDEQQLKPSGNVTNKVLQERYTLSYYLIRMLLSVEYISSIQSTPIRLIVTCDHIENVILVPVIVQNLFVNVICNSGKSKPHIMKSYALQVLDQITNTMLNDTSIAKENIDNNETMYNDLIQKRLTIACALLQCDARFDAKTKTSTIDQLLGISTSHGNVDKNDHDDTDTVLKLTLHPYMTFLEQQIIGTNRTNYEIQGYIDLLYHLGKALIRNESIDLDATQRIFGFLLTIAFFDCTNIESVETTQLVQTKKKKKEKKRQSNTATTQNHPIIEVGRLIQQSRLKSNVSPTFSYDIRSVASARFFSLLTDTITSTIHSTSTEKESRIIDILSKFHYLQTLLINAGAKKIVTLTPSDDVGTDDKDVPPDVITTKLIDDARKAHQSDNKKAPIARWKNGCAMLASTLYVHLLSCGHPDVGVDEIDPNADDEEDYEETVDLLNDLQDIAELYTKDDVTSDESPLAALAELCARILSSPLGVGSQSRGASPTLLREAVKMAWTGGLTLSASYSTDESSALDKDTVNVLLNAIGAIDDTSQGVSGGDDDESDNDIDDDDSSDDEESEEEHTAVEKGLFSSITGVDELQDHEMKKDSDHDDEDDDDDDDDDEELHVDAEKLKLLLEEESDADVDEGELEHHEGADAALAKLIQLKQEARKAGILARERTEIARQIRCIQLLETLVVGKEGTWGSLLRVDLMLHILLPILKYRSDILKSLSKAKSKGSNTGLSEKGALLSKLTVLLKNKILKAKVSDIEWTESTDVNDASDAFCSALMKLALESDDKEHQALCNSCILFLLRCIPDTKMKLERASVYTEAVTQWSTKRTTRLDVSFFEGLIHQSPVIAQASIVDAFAKAAMNGRSTYLKSESYRLLSLLYNPKLNANTTDLEKIAMSRLLESSTNVCESIASSLKDKEMKKTKRIRDVLRAADKVVQFLLVSSSIPPNCLNRLQDMINLLNELKGDSESQSIVNSVAKLLSNIQSLTSKENSNEMNIDDPVDPSEDVMETNEMSKQELTKSNKKANKSKKKKRK